MLVSNLSSISALSKPLLLAAMALVMLLFPRSWLLFDTVTTLASLIGIWGLYEIVTNIKNVRFSSTLATSILLGYGLGSFIYLLMNGTLRADEYQYLAPHGAFYEQSDLSIAIAVSLLASSLLYFRAFSERSEIVQFSPYLSCGEKSERIVWMGAAVVAYAIMTGAIGYMGSAVSETQHISPVSSIAVLIVPPLVPYILAIIPDETSFWRKVALWMALLFFIGVLVVLGRRYLLYVAVLSAMVQFKHGFRLTKRQFVSTGIVVILAGAILYWGFTFFMALRMAVATLGRDVGIVENVSFAMSLLSGEQLDIVKSNLGQNVGTRTFILSYFAGLVGINSSQMPLLGGELLYSIHMSVPSVLMPTKVAVLPASAEALSHPLYGIDVFDAPNSFLIAGYNDFWFIGVLLYPLGVALLYYSVFKIFHHLVHAPDIRLFVHISILFHLLNVEQSLTTVFVNIRDMVIVICLALLVRNFPIPRLNGSPKNIVHSGDH